MLTKYGVHHKRGFGYHPQTSGEVEVSNQEIMVILDKMVACPRKDRSDKLHNALYAYRTAPQNTFWAWL